jgi:hypothetical protein
MRILEMNVHPEEGLRRAILCTYNSEVGLEKLHFFAGSSPLSLLVNSRPTNFG